MALRLGAREVRSDAAPGPGQPVARNHEDFSAFAEAIMRFVKSTLPKNWKSFRDTVNDNSHIVRPDESRVVIAGLAG